MYGSIGFLYMQAETLGQKRVSEEAIKRLKAEAQQAVRRRETALFNAREAVVSFGLYIPYIISYLCFNQSAI